MLSHYQLDLFVSVTDTGVSHMYCRCSIQERVSFDGWLRYQWHQRINIPGNLKQTNTAKRQEKQETWSETIKKRLPYLQLGNNERRAILAVMTSDPLPSIPGGRSARIPIPAHSVRYPKRFLQRPHCSYYQYRNKRNKKVNISDSSHRFPSNSSIHLIHLPWLGIVARSNGTIA